MGIFISESEVQPNREILAPPGVDTEQDKEQLLSIGKHPSLMKVILCCSKCIATSIIKIGMYNHNLTFSV